MEVSLKDSSSSTTEVSVWQPCSFSASSLDEEDNHVQEASDENHMFLMVDENGGSSGGGSGGGSLSEENKESAKLQKYGCRPYFNSHMVAMTCEFYFLCPWACHCPHMMFLPFPL